MAKAQAEHKEVREAALQGPSSDSVFDVPPATETPLVPLVSEATSPIDDGWYDLPAEKIGPPYDGREVILTRDLEGGEHGVWLRTRSFDMKQGRWVDNGFWVAPGTRRRLYPLGVEPIAYKEAYLDKRLERSGDVGPDAGGVR